MRKMAVKRISFFLEILMLLDSLLNKALQAPSFGVGFVIPITVPYEWEKNEALRPHKIEIFNTSLTNKFPLISQPGINQLRHLYTNQTTGSSVYIGPERKVIFLKMCCWYLQNN